jgi:phenylalanyl-tRNA synthetase beta subunit
MEHFAKDMAEIKTDLKAMPDKMAILYVPKEEFSLFKKDFADMKADLHALSEKMDTRDATFVSKEELKIYNYLPRENFAPYRNAVVFIGGTFVSGLIGLIFWFIQRHFA